jgi:uncharacterized protein (TIGR00375 family)
VFPVAAAQETQPGGQRLVFADFHLHSKYSRAVSPSMDLEGLREGCRVKGLRVIGTGDFTHPRWFDELRRKLVPSSHEGLFSLQGTNEDILYLLTAEVSTIFSDEAAGKVRKVHHVIVSPDLESAAQINDALSKRGNLMADGRPTFGRMPPSEFAELVFEANPKNVVIPAHIWTPWFSVLGSKSGYDSIADAYEDQGPRIFAAESGLSSDPAMNWRLSSMDAYAIVSNSDAHSPHPWRLGRECNAFSLSEDELSYGAIFKALREKDEAKFAFTVEVNPNYGKYHFDGHRDCGVCLSPAETKKLNGLCPVCRRPLTIGVQSRVDELADRPEGFEPKHAIPFKSVLPLHELIASTLGVQLSSKKVAAEAGKLLPGLGSELHVLLEATRSELAKCVSPAIADFIVANREGKLEVSPGFDGEYGKIVRPGEESPAQGWKNAAFQKTLGEY